jgi:hypothetical protein
MSISTLPTRIAVDPFRPLAAYAGFDLAYVTTDGARLTGVTEIGTSVANADRLVVRFPDGRWAFCPTYDEVGAPTHAEWLDTTMRAQMTTAPEDADAADYSPELFAVLKAAHGSGAHDARR